MLVDAGVPEDDPEPVVLGLEDVPAGVVVGLGVVAGAVGVVPLPVAAGVVPLPVAGAPVAEPEPEPVTE